MAEPLRLHPDDLERLAELVADRLREDADPPTRIVGPAELAETFGRSPQWYREHVDVLGGWRDGDGPKAPYLFDFALAHEKLREMGANGSRPAPSPKPRRRRRRNASEVELLPVKGRKP